MNWLNMMFLLQSAKVKAVRILFWKRLTAALRDHIEEYRACLPFYDIEEKGRDYYSFMEAVGAAVESGSQKQKRLSGKRIIQWKAFVLYVRIRDKLYRMWGNVKGK